MSSATKLLVVHASALHLGYLGCYGNDNVVTPNIDRLADEGVVFDQHIADQPRIGKSPFPVHGIDGMRWLDLRAQAWDKRLPRRVLTQLNARQRGGETGLWIDLPALAPPWSIPADILAENFPAADEENDDALAPWLDPPIGPADASETAWLRLQITYAAAVTAFDALIGDIIEHLGERKLLDETMLILTANAGLALGEHGYVGEHRAWLHEEVVHVPLLVRLPGGREAGLRIPALTQPPDLLATVGQVVNQTGGRGGDLLSLIAGEVERVRQCACSRLAIGDSEELAVRTPDWHLVVPVSTPRDDPSRAPQLFVKPEDRWEVNDVRQQHWEIAEELESLARRDLVSPGS